jgi:hypothetical protein
MLRRQTERFFARVLVVTVVWVATFNAINPESFVTHVNMSRAAAGAPFDIVYHASLSADAIPSLVRAAPRLGASACRQLRYALIVAYYEERARNGPQDWRSTSLAMSNVDTWYDRGAPIDCP